jgi:hypothetical protein
VERVAGKGKLFHCRWCRLQFYDRRILATELAKAAAEPERAEDTAERSEVAAEPSEDTAERA